MYYARHCSSAIFRSRIGLRVSLQVSPALRIAICAFLLCTYAVGESGTIRGRVLDPQGASVANVTIKLLNAAGTKVGETRSNPEGNFVLADVGPGVYQVRAEASSFVTVLASVSVASGQQQQITVQFQQLVSAQQQVTVVASVPALETPDPAQTVVIHDQVLDANPGRPGAPISIPGTGQGPQFRSPGCRLKPPRGESRRRSTLRPA